MKTLILYSSKTGYTENYAKWLGEALKAQVTKTENFDFGSIENYETIIFGGGLYAGGINGIKTIKKHLSVLKKKNLTIFFTGASPRASFEMEEIIQGNFTPDEAQNIDFYYMRGGFDYTKLGLIDKILMQLLKLKIKSNLRKGIATADERGMLSAYDRAVDFTKKERIDPILAHIKEFA